MDITIVQLAPINVVLLYHVGPYDGISAKFETLWDWASSHQVPVQRGLGLYWDNPDVTDASKLRSAACIEVPAGYQLPDTGGLQIQTGSTLPGKYATTQYTGPYEQLGPVWARFTNQIEGSLGERIKENDPAIEIYVNDPGCTPPDKLITELYMPLW